MSYRGNEGTRETHARYTRASRVTHGGVQLGSHLLLPVERLITQQSADSGGNQNVNVDKADIMAGHDDGPGVVSG